MPLAAIRLCGTDHCSIRLTAIVSVGAIGESGEYVQLGILGIFKWNELSEVDSILLEEPIRLIQVVEIQFQKLQVALDLLLVSTCGRVWLH